MLQESTKQISLCKMAKYVGATENVAGRLCSWGEAGWSVTDGRQEPFGSPCFKWLVDLSLFSVTEVYKYILKQKQSSAFIRNLIIPSHLTYFMHLELHLEDRRYLLLTGAPSCPLWQWWISAAPPVPSTCPRGKGFIEDSSWVPVYGYALPRRHLQIYCRILWWKTCIQKF